MSGTRPGADPRTSAEAPATREQVRPEPATTRLNLEQTEVGSVFVSNYPPYSFWKPDYLEDFEQVLQATPRTGVPLGLYVHIPFCRRRCKFCYFRVYTDKNAEQVQQYNETLVGELALYRDYPAVTGCTLDFVYFGGGTPSFLSSRQLRELVAGLKKSIAWNGVEEVAFECEPGTLSRSKLETIREIGVTRLSLGVENFDDRILEANGRAHLSKEIFRVAPWIEELDFDQVNVDLIAGMLGETWVAWQDTVQKTIDLSPDMVTVYQMELPFNTRFSKQYFEGTLDEKLADWDTKREWQNYAFEKLAKAGYQVSSAYTMVKDPEASQFVYRDALWRGSDMIGLGVASFGHMSGVHVQNATEWGDYLNSVESGELPLSRAFPSSEDESLTREVILQLKLGKIETGYFRDKFGVEILERFEDALARLEAQRMLTMSQDQIELTRDGLLRVDSLLPEFYAPRYQQARYT